MAIYRFKVSLEDNEDIFRDIDIKSSQTFEDFHICIQEAFKFDNKHSASFFMSDDYWRKNQEITYKKEDLPLDAEEIRKKVDPKKLMGETKIAKFIEQPHQRFIYVFDSVAQWSFLIEMIKITEENPKTKYPAISRSAGTAPKQYKTVPVIKEELSPDMAMAALLSDLDTSDDEAYKTIEKVEEGVEDEDLEGLEGSEGEEAESDEDDFNDSDTEDGVGLDEEQHED
ncbi:MAG: IS1096 element passenger TnpR family protein [Bacteroidia bacterium]